MEVSVPATLRAEPHGGLDGLHFLDLVSEEVVVG